ncbi:MAG: Gfo/Idh/MocA family oxidoreductase [candidate division KSB1 bacterium]|nr:Gfo/Idh/MocA family oxidoreductase [candidate division KSB1 bacterium]
MNRREFFSRLGLAAAPFILPSALWANNGKRTALGAIQVGVIGVGKQGGGLLGGFLRRDEVRVVAVCDVDREKLAEAKRRVEEYYSNKFKRTYKGCRETIDFREIVEADDIDAVVIATPDHWHALPSVLAMRNGKDVYCEKPLSLTITEARLMRDEARRTGRILQTGSQQRSSDHFRFACELVRNGYIGEVKRVRVSIATGFLPHPIECDLPAEPVPEVLDWDRWQGQAPERPFNAILAPPISFDGFPAWRNYRPYSGGGMTDWGAHHFDIAQWGLGRDGSGPVEIIPAKLSDNGYLTYRYDDGIEMTADFEDNFIRFEGTHGAVQVNRGYLRTEPQSLQSVTLKPSEIHLYESKDHIGDFISAIRRRHLPICDVSIGASSVIVCHLGNLAEQLGRTLRWDPVNERFIDDDEANRLCSRAQRSPYRI